MSKETEMQLDRFQAEAFARGLFALAKADGVHERELALVASFWSDTGGSAAALSELSRQATITPADLAGQLRDAEVRSLFMKTAVMLTWADGEVSAAEAGLVKDFAAALEFSEQQMGQVEAEVKDYLLAHLAHIQNVEAVAEVAKKLAI